MKTRTDLAVEFAADKVRESGGIRTVKYKAGDISVSDIEICTDAAAEELGKQKGKYISLESDEATGIFDSDCLEHLISDSLKSLIGKTDGGVLVVGVGNVTVTPDALGPKTAEKIFATRHIPSNLAEEAGLNGIKPVSVLAPGVMGQTGIELKELINSVLKTVKPVTVIFIDALAAREISRLGSTVQLSNTGICPGSGIGNRRAELSKESLGVDCITVGVPTVVDAAKYFEDGSPFIVTPREIDRITERASTVIADAINICLQPDIDIKDIRPFI